MQARKDAPPHKSFVKIVRYWLLRRKVLRNARFLRLFEIHRSSRLSKFLGSSKISRFGKIFEDFARFFEDLDVL